MGQSPQEKQAKKISDYFFSGGGTAENRMAEIDPMYKQISDQLISSYNTRLSGLSQNVGESLVTSGVARGSDQAGAFYSALAPAIASEQESLAQLGQNKVSTLLNLMQLQSSGMISPLQFMKGTTAIGDILGGATTLGNILGMPTGKDSVLLQNIMGLFSKGGNSSTDTTGEPPSGDNVADVISTAAAIANILKLLA